LSVCRNNQGRLHFVELPKDFQESEADIQKFFDEQYEDVQFIYQIVQNDDRVLNQMF
jgi:hypothetical protein